VIVTDTHCHLFWRDFDADLEAVLARAHASGVGRMVVVGTDVATSQAALDMCADRTGMWATAGTHPHDAQAFGAGERAAIEALCRRPDCHGVGETGLDHFKEFAPRAAQLDAFLWHLDLAQRIDRPVVVHSRDAHEATLAALRTVPGVRGVMHCYTLGAAELPGYLELDFCISFSGVVTYPANAHNREAAAQVPLNRLLVETDAPFLAPQGRRGRRNEPSSARDVLECIARVRDMDVVELAHHTSANAARLFGLPPLPPTA